MLATGDVDDSLTCIHGVKVLDLRELVLPLVDVNVFADHVLLVLTGEEEFIRLGHDETEELSSRNLEIIFAIFRLRDHTHVSIARVTTLDSEAHSVDSFSFSDEHCVIVTGIHFYSADTWDRCVCIVPLSFAVPVDHSATPFDTVELNWEFDADIFTRVDAHRVCLTLLYDHCVDDDSFLVLLAANPASISRCHIINSDEDVALRLDLLLEVRLVHSLVSVERLAKLLDKVGVRAVE